MNEPTGVVLDPATVIFNLAEYHVISTRVLADGRRQVMVETDPPPGVPELRCRRNEAEGAALPTHPGHPVAGAVEVLLSKYRWYCEEPACARLSFFESTRPRSRVVPVPQPGSGTRLLTRSSGPAGPFPRQLRRSRCRGGWSVPH